jgi:hypothetical protein
MHGNSIVDVDFSNYQNESTMHGSSIIDVDLNNYRKEPTMHGNLMVDVDLNNDPKESTMHGNSVVDVDLNNSQTKQRYIETQLLMLAPTMRTTMTSKTRWLISNQKRYIPHPLHQFTRMVWSKKTGEWKRRAPTIPFPHHRYGPVRYIRNDRVSEQPPTTIQPKQQRYTTLIYEIFPFVE